MATITRINTPHDRYFRSVMSDSQIAREFFHENLPLDIRKLVDLNSLQPRKESFIDKKLRASITDMLYSVNFADQPGYLYFLNEHKSTAQRFLPIYLWKQIIDIMEYHIKETKSEILPVVYPIIYYNGRVEYPFSTNLFELFGQNNELAKSILLNSFQLIDLTTVSDEQLREQTWAGVMGFMMKHIRKPDILNYFIKAVPLFKRVENLGGRHYIETTLSYIIQAADIQDQKAFINIISQELSEELGEKTMTLAERLKMQGRTETQRSIALNLIQEELPLDIIKKTTGLSIKEIEALKEKELEIKS